MSETRTLNIEDYKELFYKSPLGIFTSTIEGCYIEVNEAFPRLLGYNKGELLKLKDISTEIFNDKDERARLLERLIVEKKVVTHRTTFKKKNGKLIDIILNLKLIKEDENQSYVIGLVEDISNHVSSKQAILREKQTLLTLIENIPDFIYFKGTDGELLIVNKVLRELLYDIEEGRVKDGNHKSAVAREIFNDDDKILSERLNVPERFLEFEDRKNKAHYISLTKYLVYDNNTVTGLIGIGRNLTDLKQAEKRIIESQSNLNALIESTNDLIWSVNKNYKFIIYNSAFSSFIKNHYNEIIDQGKNAFEIFPLRERAFWKKCYSKCLKGEQILEELTLSIGDKVFHFDCSFNPIFSKSLSVTSISVILVDISERKLAEQAIRESEERFRQLAENTSDSFILWDETGVLYANPAFEKIYDTNIETLFKDLSIIEKLIDDSDRQRYIRNRKKELTGKQDSKNQQYLIKKGRKNAKLIWSRHFPIYNIHGAIYRYVTVTSDLSEQKQLEDVLTATRSQQQALLDNIPFLTWLKDKNGKYISVNHPFAEFYDLKPEEIIGKTDYEILPKDEADKNSATDYEIVLSKEKKHYEDKKVLLTSNNWIETYKSPIFNEKGEIIGLTGISQDITDRKRLEETILKNEEHFRALLQHSSDAITILDKNGVITFESSLRNRIINFTVEELIGKPFKEIIHPEDIPFFNKVFDEILKTPGARIKKEYRSLHKNKKWIYVESIFSNHLDNPSIKGIVVNTRDISDRKMAELKERTYHNNLIFLSNSALELLSISERNDIYNYIAEKLHKFLGDAIVLVSCYDEDKEEYQLKQIVGAKKWEKEINTILGREAVNIRYKRNKTVENIETAGVISSISDFKDYLISPQNLHVQLKKLLVIVKANKFYSITLARNNKLLGTIAIITLNKSIIKFKHIIETFAHQVAVALHRSQLESELMAAKLKAEESDRLKTAFLANMSHEIRTPMNGILGFAEMLNDEKTKEPDRKKYIDIINSNGKILINLIDDIIDFAKIEAEQIKIVKHDFSLNALLNQIYNSFLSEIMKKDKSKVQLRVVKLLEDNESYIRTDSIRLRQIITNLIGNALKFTSEGHIEFGYKVVDDGFLEFHVEDTGIGIEPEKLELIFERFVQADNSRSRKYSGSGLGLAISKGFSELLGGTMWAKSMVNKGSTFFFSIPYVKAKKAELAVAQKRHTKSKYDWSNVNILVAEDDFFSFKFLEGFLIQNDANVLHAEDGRQAVEMCLEDKSIDIVLMDVQMPEMNGLDATITIKKSLKQLPIIAQTANAIAEEKQRCYEAGFDDFVTKPINITELFFKIDHWLAKKQDLK